MSPRAFPAVRMTPDPSSREGEPTKLIGSMPNGCWTSSNTKCAAAMGNPASIQKHRLRVLEGALLARSRCLGPLQLWSQAVREPGASLLLRAMRLIIDGAVEDRQVARVTASLGYMRCNGRAQWRKPSKWGCSSMVEQQLPKLTTIADFCASRCKPILTSRA